MTTNLAIMTSVAFLPSADDGPAELGAPARGAAADGGGQVRLLAPADRPRLLRRALPRHGHIHIRTQGALA